MKRLTPQLGLALGLAPQLAGLAWLINHAPAVLLIAPGIALAWWGSTVWRRPQKRQLDALTDEYPANRAPDFDHEPQSGNHLDRGCRPR